MKVEVNKCWHIKEQGKGQAKALSRALWTSKNILTPWNTVTTYKTEVKEKYIFFFNNQHGFHFHVYSHVLQKVPGFLFASVLTYQFHSVSSLWCWGASSPLSRLVSRRQFSTWLTAPHNALLTWLCLIIIPADSVVEKLTLHKMTSLWCQCMCV